MRRKKATKQALLRAYRGNDANFSDFNNDPLSKVYKYYTGDEMEEFEEAPLQLVNNLVINNPIQVEACPLCLETVIYPQGDNQLPSGFCRVNCPRGHTFHCWCISQWRKERRSNGSFQNDCPICRQVITQMTLIDPPPQPPNVSNFGKKFNIKEVNSDIKFLLK